jgi:thiamine-phosphate pyrophosphorylase
MRASQPHTPLELPRLWLMTDERQGEAVLDAVARLPTSAGIVFRHYSLAEVARRDLFGRVRAAHAGLLLLAGPAELAKAWAADGSHGRGPGAGLRTASAHDLAEIRAAEAAGAAAIFLGPVFPTRSHPERAPLGPEGFAALARQTALPVIALGGVSAERAEGLAEAYGWAGIDAFA